MVLPLPCQVWSCSAQKVTGVLRLLGVLQGPSQALCSLALLSPNGLALGMNELHVLRWTGAESNSVEAETGAR